MSEFPSREEFREWLVAKDPDEIVDSVNEESLLRSEDCALARNLKERGVRRPNVSFFEWHDAEPPHPMPVYRPVNHDMPDWASMFVHVFDHVSAEQKRDLTAKDALGILDDLDVIG